MARHLEALARVRDLGPVHAQDREVLIVIIPDQKVAAVRREHDSLGQTAHFDLLDLRDLLTLDLQDIDRPVLVIEIGFLAGVRAAQDRRERHVPLGLIAMPSGPSPTTTRSTMRGGLASRSMTLTVSTLPSEDPMKPLSAVSAILPPGLTATL